MNSPARKGKYVIPVLIIFLVIAVSTILIVNRDGVVPPHIELQQTTATLPVTDYSFPFEAVTVSLTGKVDPAVYYGAKSADKETIIRGNISEDIWQEETYRAMVNDPAQDGFYSTVITPLRSVRNQQNLDDDEYLELMTVFIQSIPYESLSDNPPKFPVETFVDKSGDCDDKSLLLAGLLSREGYNVSLLSFTPESHMAVGVICPGGEYKKTGYTFIETTNLSFAGVTTDTLGDNTRLLSDPLVIRVGNGTKVYRSCSESQYMDSVYDLSEQKVMELTKQIDTLKAEMDGYYAKHDVKNYNQRVPLFNDLQHKRLQYAEIHNYILEHQYDRKGTYQYVNANMPE
jgi:hypothetical protein